MLDVPENSFQRSFFGYGHLSGRVFLRLKYADLFCQVDLFSFTWFRNFVLRRSLVSSCGLQIA